MKRLASFTRMLGSTPIVWALIVLGGCGAEGDRTGFIVLPDMVESTPIDTYGRDALAPQGRALRMPPPGVVAIGQPFYGFGAGEAEAARAGRELVNPLAPTAEVFGRGRELYETFCLVCHGPGGEGDGPVIGAFPNPPSLLAEHARELPDGQMHHVISRGQGIMAAYASQVRLEDRWRIVWYLRQLQGLAEPSDPSSEDER